MRRVRVPHLFVLLAAGCYGSHGEGDVGDVGRDAPVDAAVDSPPETWVPDVIGCLTDDDCVIALPEDRCCNPDPIAVHRSLLDLDPCLHALGEPWGERHPGCSFPCYACQPIERRYYAARCEAGTCVGVEDFCPPMPAPAPVAELRSEGLEDGGWEAYAGQYVSLWGHHALGPDSCACAGGPCPCRDVPVQNTIGCALTVRGSTCGIPWECGGTECDPTCSPVDLPYYGLVEGYIVGSDATGPEFWITTTPTECGPPGPNPDGGRCHAFDEASDCADGLFCYYWGDVIMGCDGTCRAPGTECTGDEDCRDGDICYHGYCEWCCPG
jgi:hypothetical protein